MYQSKSYYDTKFLKNLLSPFMFLICLFLILETWPYFRCSFIYQIYSEFIRIQVGIFLVAYFPRSVDELLTYIDTLISHLAISCSVVCISVGHVNMLELLLIRDSIFV